MVLEFKFFCMPSVTGKHWFQHNQNSKKHFQYHEVILCKWELNGTDYNDTITEAIDSCLNIDYWHGLWSIGDLSLFNTTDQIMLNYYISSSTCEK